MGIEKSKERSLFMGVVFACFAFGRAALADGIVGYVDPSRDWQLVREDHQHAVVSLQREQEHLLLQVALGSEVPPVGTKGLLWLVPIPAPAAKVRSQILPGFPALRGTDVVQDAAREARRALSLMLLSQLWSAPLTALTLSMKSAAPPTADVVAQRIERDGIELEIWDAPGIAVVSQKVHALGVDLSTSALEALAPSLGAGRSLVMYRIVDAEAVKRAQGEQGLGIAVSFPTARGFFPLRVSAALPGTATALKVTVLGLARAPTAATLPLRSRYFVGSMDASPEVVQALGLEQTPDRLTFTELSLVAAPASFKEDLSFEVGAPLAPRLSIAWMTHPHRAILAALLTLGVFIVLAVLSSIAGSLLWSRQARPALGWSVWLGVLQLFTLLLPARLILAHGVRMGATRSRAWLVIAFTSGLLALLIVSLLLLVWRI